MDSSPACVSFSTSPPSLLTLLAFSDLLSLSLPVGIVDFTEDVSALMLTPVSSSL